MKRMMKPVHPGAILREDILKHYNVTITEAAKELKISRKHLSEVVNERAILTVEMAVRLDQVFGVAAEFWLDLQKKFDIWKVYESGKIRLHPHKSRLTA